MIKNMHDSKWWRNATVYEIYPRSFHDSNGDGIGDLEGVRSRLPYLDRLGIDAIWLTPFYPSPQVDGGYDVADYRNVDPSLGTLADFDRLVRDAHERGIKVIIDIVPNHCSDQHPWFQRALDEGPGSPMRCRFVFHKGKGPDGKEPPTNWLTGSGDSTWEPCGDGWYYLHLFTRQQPDFNWENPDVRKDFLTTLAFWGDRGADGFRVDVSHGLAKDLREPLRDRTDPFRVDPCSDRGDDPIYDRDEVHGIYREWRRLFDRYDPPRMAIGESWTPITQRVYAYARPDELGSVFDFSLQKCDWDANKYRRAIMRTWEGLRSVGSAPNWTLDNHDVPRIASRLALPGGLNPADWVTSAGSLYPVDPAVGLARARSAAMIILGLPGTAYLYQGDELGLPEDLELGEEEIQDPCWEQSGHKVKGRDGCRIPLPWTISDRGSYGFSPPKGSSRPWLPQPAWFARYAADRQETDPKSTLNLYRRAIALRDRWVTADGCTGMTMVDTGDHPLLHFRLTTGLHSLTNFGQEPLELPEGVQILLRSDLLLEDEATESGLPQDSQSAVGVDGCRDFGAKPRRFSAGDLLPDGTAWFTMPFQ